MAEFKLVLIMNVYAKKVKITLNTPMYYLFQNGRFIYDLSVVQRNIYWTSRLINNIHIVITI